MDDVLRVGIIGASAGRGWARISHVPAVQELPGLALHAVVGSSQASADAAARAFGIATAHADAASLFRDPSIDIVAVKVPDHRALALAAVAAGKHLYCEWPLGRNTAETVELAAAIRESGVHAAIGLQARADPAVRQARRLVLSGAVGRVLSARIVSTTMAFGPEVEPAMAFAEDPANGVTLPSIQGAHTLDVAAAVLGRFASVSAMATTQFPEVRIGVDQATRRTCDHLLVQARLTGGAPVSIEVAGGRPADDTPFRFEITGETGTLVLEGGAPRGFQSGRLRLLLDNQEQRLDGVPAASPETAASVAGIYAALRDDIRNGTWTAPGADDALRLSRLLDDVLRSAETGTSSRAGEWPEPL